MGDLFDKLAKDAAADLPRRKAFRLIGGSLLGVVLAAVGLAADKDNCGKLCRFCCDQNFTPPPDKGDGGEQGRKHAQCLLDCHEGKGLCGEIYCPGGLRG